MHSNLYQRDHLDNESLSFDSQGNNRHDKPHRHLLLSPLSRGITSISDNSAAHDLHPVARVSAEGSLQHLLRLNVECKGVMVREVYGHV